MLNKDLYISRNTIYINWALILTNSTVIKINNPQVPIHSWQWEIVLIIGFYLADTK